MKFFSNMLSVEIPVFHTQSLWHRVGFSSIICDDGSVSWSQEAKFDTSREFPKLSGNSKEVTGSSSETHTSCFTKQINDQHTVRWDLVLRGAPWSLIPVSLPDCRVPSCVHVSSVHSSHVTKLNVECMFPLRKCLKSCADPFRGFLFVSFLDLHTGSQWGCYTGAQWSVCSNKRERERESEKIFTSD